MTEEPFASRGERRRTLLHLRRHLRNVELRDRIMELCYGCVAAALALSFPAAQPARWGGEAARRLAGDGEPITQGLLFPVASGFQAFFDVEDANTTVRVLAGLAFGAALTATLVCLRRLGFRRTAAIPATVAAYACTFAWVGSTSPIDYAFGLLGSAVLLLNLCSYEQSTARGYQWRAVLAAGLAYLLHPETVLLIPAVALAVARHPAYRREPIVNFGAVVLVMVMSIAIGLSGPDERTRLGHLVERALAGADGPTFDALAGWVPALLVGLGAIVLGLHQLVLAARAADSQRAPLWIVPWCFAALVPVLAGTPDHTPIAPYIVPAGALGLADGLNRLGSGRREALFGVALVAAQLALCAFVSRPLPA